MHLSNLVSWSLEYQTLPNLYILATKAVENDSLTEDRGVYVSTHLLGRKILSSWVNILDRKSFFSIQVDSPNPTQFFPPQGFQSSWGSLWSLEAFLLFSSSGKTIIFSACPWSLKSQNHSHSTTSYFPHPHHLALQGFSGRDDQGGDPIEGRLHSHRGLDPPTSQTSSQGGCSLLNIKYGFISNVIVNHRH